MFLKNVFSNRLVQISLFSAIVYYITAYPVVFESARKYFPIKFKKTHHLLIFHTFVFIVLMHVLTYYIFDPIGGGVEGLVATAVSCPKGQSFNFHEEDIPTGKTAVQHATDLHNNNEYPCKVCDIGTYGNTNDICRDCLAGEYQDEKGQTSCKPCKKGEYQASPGQTSCKPCPDGKSTTTTGRSRKVDCTCPAGTYQSDVGKSSCKQCPDGTYSKPGSSEKSSCLNCPSFHTRNKSGDGCVAMTDNTSCCGSFCKGLGKGYDESLVASNYGCICTDINNVNIQFTDILPFRCSDLWDGKGLEKFNDAYNTTDPRWSSQSSTATATQLFNQYKGEVNAYKESQKDRED